MSIFRPSVFDMIKLTSSTYVLCHNEYLVVLGSPNVGMVEVTGIEPATF